MNPRPPKLFYEFSGFRLDTERNRLFHNTTEVGLTHKAVEVLRVLIERRGEVVDRNELMDTVWSEVTVEDGNLSVTVSLLRKMLCEYSAEKFIETFPKRGYKFVGDVREVFQESSALLVETRTVGKVVIDEDLRLGKVSLTTLGSQWRLAVVLLGALGLGVGVWAYFSRSDAAHASTPRVHSLAVLPFRQIGDSGANNYQGLGLADILITRLSNIKELTVRPTSAVMSFNNADQNSVAIGQKLMVDAVLEGSVLQVENRIRVTTRLIRVGDETPIWSGEFEVPANDELRMQRDIALQVVDALVPALNTDTQKAVAKHYTESQDAYQLYLKGRYHWSKRNKEGLLEAERLYRSAIEKDPGFALAYVGLADILVLDYPSKELHVAIEKALELDPNLAEAYATKGFMLFVHYWKWEEAEECFRRSVALNPGYATAHHWYGTLLGVEGRYDEAKREILRALEINPLSHNFLADLGQIYYFNREYDRAEEYCEKALSLYPDFNFALLYLSYIKLQQGDYEGAIDADRRAENALEKMPYPTAELDAARTVRLEQLKAAYHAGGIKSYLKLQLRSEQQEGASRNPNRYISLARKFALIGDKEKAIENLETAFKARAFLMPWVGADPLFDPVRSEPRFKAILRQMDLSETF